MAPIGNSGPWVKLIREKNQKVKISGQTLFKARDPRSEDSLSLVLNYTQSACGKQV
jgi:hypothetical protein